MFQKENPTLLKSPILRVPIYIFIVSMFFMSAVRLLIALSHQNAEESLKAGLGLVAVYFFFRTFLVQFLGTLSIQFERRQLTYSLIFWPFSYKKNIPLTNEGTIKLFNTAKREVALNDDTSQYKIEIHEADKRLCNFPYAFSPEETSEILLAFETREATKVFQKSTLSDPTPPDRLHKIRIAFSEYFGNAQGATLPANLKVDEVREIDHVIHDGLWGGNYRLYYVDDSYHLDFFAYNHHTNSRHIRIREDGELETLETYWEFGYTVYEDDPERTEREKNEMIARNNTVSEILKAKGLE